MKKLLFIIAFFIFAAPLKADIVPEPQIIFNFKYLTQEALTINPLYSEQVQCADNLCMEPKPLASYGIQKLKCTPEECFSIAYEFEPFQKLVITFSDGKTRESQIFPAPKNLRSVMQVTVKEDSLYVEYLHGATIGDRNTKAYVTVSFVSAFLLELAAAFIFLAVGGLSLKVLFSVGAANIISIPFGWWVLAGMLPNAGVVWVALFMFELIFIYLFNRSRISFKECAGMVFIMNIASFSLGMAVNYMFTVL